MSGLRVGDGRSRLEVAPRTVTGKVADLLASEEVAGLIQRLESTRWTGRPGYPIRMMVGLTLAKGFVSPPTWPLTIHLVTSNPTLREVIGCETTPSQWACYRFERKLRDSLKPILAQPAATPLGLLCACGCGGELNPLLGPSLAMRKEKLSFREIGERLGVSGAYVRMLVRKPPKYIKGHSGKAADWITVVCDGCGEGFRTTTTSGRTYCKRRHCKSSRLDHEAYDQFIRRLDEREEHDRRVKHAAVVRERHEWRRYRTWEFGERFANLAARERAEAMREATRHEELAALVAEQEREMRWRDYEPDRRWISRLDEPIRSHAKPQVDFGGTWQDVLPDPVNGDPAALIETADAAERRRRLLGDLAPEGVDRLSESTLDHLRECLREEGLVNIGVQKSERKRLRQPVRHRGSAPPPTWKSMATTPHHRKPGHVSSVGSKHKGRKQNKRRRAPRDGYGAVVLPEAA